MKIASNVIWVGTSMGTILLLVRWITGNALLSSEQSLVKFGILFAIILNCAYGTALIFLSFFMKKINRSNMKNFFEESYSKLIGVANKRFIKIVCYFVQLELWIVQIVVLSTFYQIFFGSNGIYWTFITIGIMVVICYIASIKATQSIALMYSILLFVTLTIIPIYYFILNGSTEVYEGIRLYHPYLLYFKDSSYVPFYIALFIIACCHVLVDLPTWYTISLIEKSKRSIALLITGVIKILISFSLTAILLIAIYQGPFENIEMLLLSYLHIEESNALSYLFAAFCLMSILAPLLVSVKSMQNLNNGDSNGLTILFLIGILFSIIFVKSIHLLDIIIYFGLIYVALMPLFVMFLFTSLKLPKNIYLYFISLVIFGQGLYYMSNNILLTIFMQLLLGFLSYYFAYKQPNSLERAAKF